MERLGRLPADPRQLALAPKLAHHRFGLSPPPPSVDRCQIELQPVLGQNDVLPDCTTVGLLNAARMVAALNGYQLAAHEDRCKAFYAEVVGCEPTDAAIAATDGVWCLDVLKRQATRGFDVGLQTELVALFGRLPETKPMLANSIAHLGHAYLGVLLHERDMEGRPVWDVQPGRDDGEAVGGHLIVAWDYLGLGPNQTVRMATWGHWRPATWAWVTSRTEEAYGLVWRQLIGSDGRHLGVDADDLAAQLLAFAETT